MCQLPINALDEENFSTDGTTLKLNNQKNGWKGVCVYQEHNEDEKSNPVITLGRRCVSIQNKANNKRHNFQQIGLEAEEKISMLRT